MGHEHTTKLMIQKKAAEHQMQEQIMAQRKIFLSRLCTAVMGLLDQLCGNQEKDKVDVLTSLLGYVAVRAKGTEEELQKMVAQAFKEQTENDARLKAAAEAAKVAPSIVLPDGASATP